MDELIRLEKEFESKCDQLTGLYKFTQIKRTENVAMYRREYADGRLHSYEVFQIFICPEGTKLPGGNVIEKSYEKYPTANSGKSTHCRFIQDNDDNKAEDRAIEAFNIIVKEVEDKKNEIKKVRVAKVKVEKVEKKRPVVTFPDSEFCMNDLVKLNPNIQKSILYVTVKEFQHENKIVEVRRQKSVSGKGKPMVVYSLIKG